MIKAGIIGVTGYAGAELVRILLGHGDAKIVWYGTRSYKGEVYSDIYQNFRGVADVVCEDENMLEASKVSDVVFTATPQGFCASAMSEEILDNAKVIDLSADYRIEDVSVYEKWYNMKHANPDFKSVYGLCEINRDLIKNSRLIANPGCYPTCSILAIAPLLKAGLIKKDGIIIDAKSGTTGAGRGAKVDNLFCEVNESIKAYSVAGHRHTPEIEQELSKAAGGDVHLVFTPHLVPMMRGILITAYADICEGVETSDVRGAYEEAYMKETFVRVLPEDVYPQTKWVEGSNFVDINAKIDKNTGKLIIMGAMDNLVKGAAGQAVQNMNIIFGLNEKTGLEMMPLFP